MCDIEAESLSVWLYLIYKVCRDAQVHLHMNVNLIREPKHEGQTSHLGLITPQL